MQRSMILLATVAALATLSACSKKTDTAATGTAANTTATASASSSGPMGFPSRKAGLWEQTVSSDQFHQTMSMCLDAATDAKMKVWGSQMRGGKTDCSEQKITPRLGGGWSIHAVCAMGESGTVTTDGEASGDFGSHYTVDMTSTTSGSPMQQANGVHKVKMEATWKGPCPADMKGGDMALPGGMKINVLDAAAGKPAFAGAGGHMDRAQMEAMRKQALEMAKQMKAEQKQ
ncbi:DUF3617 domain-containing protein [Phenylobacterium sp.]|uniref:DUF3617 domain-containing protein n=1 Tax=Phenylobacterium sp. TaxID=1871053 RepID=UPI002F4036BB